MNYDATFQEMEEVAKSLEQNSVSLKANTAKNKGMVNATSTSSCTKCKFHNHTTKECKTEQCTLCNRYWHKIDK